MTDGIWTEVYVVLDCVWRDGAEVIGAGTNQAAAESVADRRDDPYRRYPEGGWGPWKLGHDGIGRRDGLNADGSIHVSIYQEIVPTKLVGDQVPAAS